MEQSAQPASPSSKSTSISKANVNKLGVFLDGWAELVEGKGNKTTEVKQTVYQLLMARHMPEIEVKQIEGSVGVGSQKRPYNITTTHPNATTAIYIGEHGQDMYVSWRTFIRPKVSDLAVFLVFISFIIGLLVAMTIYTTEFSSLFYTVSGQDFLGLVFSAFVSTTLFVLIGLLFITGVLGLIFKGDFRAFFFVEPNIFDAEDITAMGLSAHKSIVRALDSTGEIDVSKLRLKQNFKGGRSREVV